MNVEELLREYFAGSIKVNGASYIGAPKDNTIMFVSKKVGNLVLNLKNNTSCIVFAENGLEVPENILDKNIFVFSDNPQRDYACFGKILSNEIKRRHKELKYKNIDGYTVGENTKIGKNSYIEPGVFIDHDVIIGDNVEIYTGAIIRYGTKIGDNCIIRENTVIGDPPFNVVKLDDDNTFVMPCFGNVVLNNNIFVGANSLIARGTAGNTIIHNSAKIDGLVKIGHDCVVGECVEIMGCTILGGFCTVGKGSVVAMNSILKNRIHVGNSSFIGMGSVLQHSIGANKIMTGNPAITLEQYGKNRAFKAEMKTIIKSIKNNKF